MSESNDYAANSEAEPQNSGSRPLRVRLPGFVGDTEIGLGDAIKRATASLGVSPCGGGTRRAAALKSRGVF